MKNVTTAKNWIICANGKLLAQEKPHLAHFLAEKEGDPDVERLMEAFAFMSGSLRQKLEDEFPNSPMG